MSKLADLEEAIARRDDAYEVEQAKNALAAQARHHPKSGRKRV